MDIPLRVLIIEDSDRDVALEVRALKAAGYQVTHAVAETAFEMKAALAEQTFDIVISDHGLPQFDAPGALAVLQESGLDIPFIVVSGSIGEETAVALMKAGAHDYVMKDRLSRLVPAIQKELREAESRREHKRAEEWLLRERSMVDRIMKTSPAGIVVVNRDGRIIFANKRAEEIYGRVADEMTQLAYNSPEWLITDFDGNPFPIEKLPHAMVISSGNPVYGIRHAIHSPEGRRVYLSINGAPIHDENGNSNEVVFTINDVTDRRQAEEALRESELRYRLLFEEADDGIALADAETGEIVDCNQTLCRMTEQNKTELIGQPQSILHPQHQLINGFSSSFHFHKTGVPGQILEDNLLSKSGKIIMVEIKASRFGMNGCDYLLGIFRDITDRKQAEEKLKDTLESLRNALNTIIQVLISAVEIRDPYTAGHQIRSADLARAIATEMGLPLEKIDAIRMAGSIHDIGKLSIPAEILSKPTKLSEIEWSLIKEHARRGFEMLKDVESPWPLAEIVHQHHERMDGSGYPRNLKGEEICIEARILAVADVVETMASHRPYRPSLGIDAALNEIEKNRGTFYDNAAADTCLRLFREKGFKLEGTPL